MLDQTRAASWLQCLCPALNNCDGHCTLGQGQRVARSTLQPADIFHRQPCNSRHDQEPRSPCDSMPALVEASRALAAAVSLKLASCRCASNPAGPACMSAVCKGPQSLPCMQ